MRNHTDTSRLRGLMFVACLGLLLLFQWSADAQVVSYARFSFDGTTTCANEVNWADSTADFVVTPVTMHRSEELGNAGPICVATTASNNMYNSKNWSGVVTRADYDALPYDQKTFIYWGFELVQTPTPYYFDPTVKMVQMFEMKRYGNGPAKGYVRCWFSSDGGSSWYEAPDSPSSEWLITNSSTKDMRFEFTVPNDGYGGTVEDFYMVKFELHGFNQDPTGGQGDGLMIDDMRIIGPPDPTPVELVSFSSSLNGNVVDLRWKTATEINNYGFEIQRSVKSDLWDAIGFVQGAGTTNDPQSYSFSDVLTPDLMQVPTLFYRLRQMDRDGTQEISPVVSVETRPTVRSVQLFQNYPNPFNPETKIAFSLPSKQNISLVVYDVLGSEVERIYNNSSLEAGFHVVSFGSSALTSGTYIYTLTTLSGSFSRTMQVAK